VARKARDPADASSGRTQDHEQKSVRVAAIRYAASNVVAAVRSWSDASQVMSNRFDHRHLPPPHNAIGTVLEPQRLAQHLIITKMQDERSAQSDEALVTTYGEVAD
jgi:hypothetical protein